MNYVKVYLEEGSYDFGEFGIEVHISAQRPMGDIDKRVIRQAVSQIKFGIMAETVRLRPETEVYRKEEREEIVRLFPSQIFVEEIPNGYCSDWCCTQKPWFIVTTLRGRITIGWRKRVLQIDWSGSEIKAKAEELFTSEDVTKSDRMIHAWSCDKARAYIEKLLEAA